MHRNIIISIQLLLRQQTCSCSDQYSYLKTKSPAQCKDLMSSNTDEGILLSHKILVGPQSHSKGNTSLYSRPDLLTNMVLVSCCFYEHLPKGGKS
jgi:hypothetical protein